MVVTYSRANSGCSLSIAAKAVLLCCKAKHPLYIQYILFVFSMLLRILVQLGLLYGFWPLVTGTCPQQHPPPPLLLVSFDGFGADYLQRFPMHNLTRLYSQGVLVEQLTNVFITKTFPNHYSLVSQS